MKKIFAFSFLILVSIPAQALHVDSECDSEIFVATAKDLGGGADDIGTNNGGSWTSDHSEGWTRIGPYKGGDGPDGEYVLVGGDGGKFLTPLTDDPKHGINVKKFCITNLKDQGFNFSFMRVDHRSGGGKWSVDTQCHQKGGQMVAFFHMPQGLSIRGEMCKGKALQPLQSWTGSTSRFTKQGDGTWLELNTSTGEKVSSFKEIGRTESSVELYNADRHVYLMLEPQNVLIHQGQNGAYQALYAGRWEN